jgi:hypothetical protein
VSSVASTLATASARDMIAALIAGERDPQVRACQMVCVHDPLTR